MNVYSNVHFLATYFIKLLNFTPYTQVNVLGLCMVTREFIKQLRERNVDDGHVFFMNRYSCSERAYARVTR